MAGEPTVVPGSVVWVDLDPVQGREQSGRRPAVVVSAAGYLDVVTTLVVCVPVTTVDRGWPNHVRLDGPTGLDRPSWAMTEQVRTLSRRRVVGRAGVVDDATLAAVRTWLADFLDLDPR
ncbi:type II toxin-antitoxin system PemK/MazF family toxin [Rhodococcus aerolatus]